MDHGKECPSTALKMFPDCRFCQKNCFDGERWFQRCHHDGPGCYYLTMDAELARLRGEVERLTRERDEVEQRARGAEDIADLMRDEFLRIRSRPGCDEEIAGLCNRAVSSIHQHVPVIVQRDRYERQRDKLVSAIECLRAGYQGALMQVFQAADDVHGIPRRDES